MCEIRDLVEKRSINPTLTIRSGYVDFCSILKDYQGIWIFEKINRFTESNINVVELKNNEMLIDALIAGQELYSGKSEKEIVEKWLEKHGLILTNFKSDTQTIAGFTSLNYPNALINCILLVYIDFCKFLKAKYGYDPIDHSATISISPMQCATDFFLRTDSTQIIKFDGSSLKIQKAETSLVNALHSMLAQYVSTDNTWQKFTCATCGKISLRRNPKQCYCSECSKKRYQVSRQKKRLEGK